MMNTKKYIYSRYICWTIIRFRVHWNSLGLPFATREFAPRPMVFGMSVNSAIADMNSSRVLPKGTEGPDISAKMEPKAVEGPDIRRTPSPLVPNVEGVVTR